MKIEWTWVESIGRWRAISLNWIANVLRRPGGRYSAWISLDAWTEEHYWTRNNIEDAKESVRNFLDEREELKALREFRAASAALVNLCPLDPEFPTAKKRFDDAYIATEPRKDSR